MERSNSLIKLWHTSDIQGETKKIFDHIEYTRCKKVEEADYILIPDTFTTNHHGKNTKWLQDIYLQTIRLKKPYVAFLHDDPDRQMTPYADRGILFRTSFNRSESTKSEFSLPSFVKEISAPFETCTDKGLTIGFCGALTHVSRVQCINRLRKDPAIVTKCIIRNTFHGDYTKDEKETHEKEFLFTLSVAPYQLCCRGAGNFSHRFYETLMYGRIPVLLDTDIPLPCEGEIDWGNYIVLAKTVEELPAKLIEWHNTHNVIEKQKECRRLWETYLCAKGFARYVEKVLAKNKTRLV